MDIYEIRKLLPHRYPFLMVDRVYDIKVGVFCIGEKLITINEPCYADVTDNGDNSELQYPVSLLLESFAQVGALLVLASRQAINVDESFVMLAGSIRGVKIFGDVIPGEILIHKVKIVKELQETVVIGGDIMVSRLGASTETLVASVGSLVIALRPRTSVMTETAKEEMV